MALDREIIISIEAPGTRNQQGIYEPGPVTAYNVWAERRAAGSNDQPTSGGFITVSAQSYLVRWFEELELANIALVSVEDEFGQVWDPDSIAPGDARRRFITMQCLRTTLTMPPSFRIASFDATATAGGSVSLRVKGGEKIRRFVFRANNPRLVATLAAAAVRRRLLPQLKQAMPRRTGALINNLEIRQNGSNIELWGIWYSRLVTIRGVQVVVNELMDLLERHRVAIGQDVIKGLL